MQALSHNTCIMLNKMVQWEEAWQVQTTLTSGQHSQLRTAQRQVANQADIPAPIASPESSQQYPHDLIQQQPIQATAHRQQQELLPSDHMDTDHEGLHQQGNGQGEEQAQPDRSAQPQPTPELQ